MRFLVTNDDGFMAVGIRTLAEAAAPLGDVRVVAPDREQSATSHSLTLHYPLRVRQAEPAVEVVDGTPTDCVVLGLGELLAEKPDFVLSGINHGQNLGDDVLYSGTVAAAMEATILGVPAAALSLVGAQQDQLEGWAPVVARVLAKLLRSGGTAIPPETLLNINLPPVPPAEVKGVRVTTLGRREYLNAITRAAD